MPDTKNQMVTLRLADGTDLTVDVAEIESAGAQVTELTPTRGQWKTVISWKRTVKKRDGRELELR